MYATEEYYLNSYHGESVEPADFPTLLARAEEIIEEMTMYRLNQASFSGMSEEVQERIKKAVCAQIEYLDANGGSDLDNGVDFQSAALGKFNYSKPVAGGSGQSVYAQRAIRILMPTGLLYRGGGCR